MDEKLAELIGRSIYYRGVILNSCITLEKDIEMYIINHFLIDVRRLKDMHEVVLQKLTFDSKISIFQELLKRKDPEIDFDKTYKKLFAEIRYIKDIRNKFAHLPVFVGYKQQDKIPKEFSLISYANTSENKPFTKGDFDQFKTRLEKCLNVISELNP